MKHSFFLFTLLVVMLCSCQHETFEPLKPPTRKYQVCNPLTPEDVKVKARALMTELFPDEPIRSARRNVKNISLLNRSAVRSNSNVPDTLLYIVNFDNEEGFLVMGAYDMMPPVYAASDEGNMPNYEELPDAAQLIMDRIIADAQGYFPIDPLPDQPTDSIPYGPHPVAQWPAYGPHLGYYQSHMHNSMEYSIYCFDAQGRNCRTGCGPVAAEMYLSFFKYPTQYKGEPIDWDKINAGEDHDGACKILGWLGLPENLNANYVYAYPDEVLADVKQSAFTPTFRDWGYTFGFFLCFFNNINQAYELLKTQPLLMCGRNPSNGGHAWIIDGTKILSKGIHFYTLYHCCWGWGGNCNGYYYVNDTHSFTGEPMIYGSGDDMGEGGHSEFVNLTNYIQFLNNVVPQ